MVRASRTSAAKTTSVDRTTRRGEARGRRDAGRRSSPKAYRRAYVVAAAGGTRPSASMHRRARENSMCERPGAAHTLNLNSITSPSCTTYSFPSCRTIPFSRAAAIDPLWAEIKSGAKTGD